MKLNVRDLALKHAREILYIIKGSDDILQSRVEFISDSVEDVLKYSPKEFVKTPGLWYSIIHPKDIDKVKNSLKQIRETKESMTLTYRLRHKKNRRYCWVEDTITLEKDGKGVRFIGCARDITNKKEAATALLEERFRTIFENASIGIYRTAPDGRVLLANSAMIKMLGFKSFEELAKYNLEEEGHYLAGYPRAKFRELVEEKGHISGFESMKKRKNGSLFCVRENARVVYDENHNVAYYEGTIEDISDRKQAEEALRKSEETLAMVTNSIDDAIYSIDGGTAEFTYLSPAFERMLGYSLSDIREMGGRWAFLSKVVETENTLQSDPVADRFQKQRIDKAGVHCHWWRCKDGSRLFLEDKSSPTYDGDRLVRMDGVLRDITKNKQADEALQKSKETLAIVTNSIDDAIYSIDGETAEFTYLSPAFGRMFGYSLSDIREMGGRLAFLSKAVERENMSERDQIIGSPGRSMDESRVLYRWWRCKDGSRLFIEDKFSMTYDGDRLVRNDGVLRDITRHRQADEALQKSEKTIRDITESISDIIYSVDGQTEEFNYLSPAFEKLLGYTEDDVHKMGGRRAFLEQVLQLGGTSNEVTEIFNELRTKEIKEAPIFERWWRCKDGSLVCLEDRSTPVFEGDQFLGTRGVLRNVTDRKRVEETLSMLTNSIDDVIYSIDGETAEFAYISPAFERMLGYSLSDIDKMGGRWAFLSKIVEGADVSKSDPVVDEFQAKRNNDSPVHQHWWRHKDGTLLFIEDKSSPTYDGDRLVRIDGVLRDITERKRADEALQKSEKTIRDITESVQDIIYSVDGQTEEFNYLSPAFEKLLGYTAEDVHKMGGRCAFLEQVAQSGGTSNRDEIFGKMRAREIKEAPIFEFWWRCKDGSMVCLEDRSTPVFEGDRFLGTRGVLRNVTDRKRAEEALRESEEKLRMIFENAYDGINIMEEDPDPNRRRLVDCNRRYAELSGRSREELLSIGYTYRFTKSVSQEIPHGQINSLKDGSVFRGTASWIRPDGKYNIYEYIGVPISIKGKRYTVGIDRDVTEQKIIDEALRKSEETLAIVTNSIDDAIYSIDGGTAEFTYLSPAFERMLGYSLSDIEKMGGRWAFLSNAVAEEGVSKIDPVVDEFPKRKIDWTTVVHHWWRCKDGSLLFIEDKSSPTYDGDRLVRIDGVLRDITARKNAEDAIQNERVLLRTLIDNLPYAVYVKDTNYRKVIANPVDVSLCGYSSEEEVIGKTDFDLFPKEVAEQFFQDEQKVIREGESVLKREERFIDSNNKEHWLLTSSIPLRDKKGVITGLVGVGIDITEQRKLDEALRQSEAELRALFDSMRDVILVLDKDGRFLKVLSKDDSILYKPASEVIGRTSYEISPKEQADFFLSVIRKTLESGEAQSAEYDIKIGDDKKWRFATVTKLTDDSVLWVARDITELKLKQKEITESERKYRELVENSLVGVFKMNLSGHMTYTNKSMAEMLEYGSPQDLMSVNSLDLYASRDEREELMKDLRENSKTEKNKEVQFVTKSGKIKNVLISASLDGTVMSAMVKDITDIRALEQQFIQTQKLEGLGNIAAGIAHDFNNILGVIVGYSDLLTQSKYDQKKFDRGIRTITKAADRGKSLVKQLLTFARKTAMTFDSLVVNDIVIEIERLLAETFPKTIEIHTELQKNLPPILADSTQIHQVLLNLCVNARDAMPKGGKLFIWTKTIEGKTLSSQHPEALSAEYIEVQVSDTGTGMDEETHKHIFEPFFTTKGVGKGTGLGLSVVHGIVESHRGFIDVVSELSKGTTFSVFFPVQERAAEQVELKSETSDDIESGAETVLIIEDEEMLRELLRTILESKGYKVISACDGEEGVQMFLENKNEVALVVSDLGLPKLSGEEVVSSIKQIDQDAKLIIASGFIDPEMRSDLEKIGVISFILKPYKTNEVLQVVHDAIAWMQ